MVRALIGGSRASGGQGGHMVPDDRKMFAPLWGGAGSGDGEFALPKSVAVNGSGEIYVVDSDNYRIQKFMCP